MQRRICSSGGSRSHLREICDDSEMEVAEILLQLSDLITSNNSNSHAPCYSWGFRKRRSAVSGRKQSPSTVPLPNLSSPLPPSAGLKVAGATASPMMAFLFPWPTESDAGSLKLSKRLRISSRPKTEESLEPVNGYASQCGDFLMEHKDDHEEEEAIRSQSGIGETARTAAGSAQSQSPVGPVTIPNRHHWHSPQRRPYMLHPPPYISDPTAGPPGTCSLYHHSSHQHGDTSSSCTVSHVGIDLNLPPREPFLQPSDLIMAADRRAMNRAARMRRVHLRRMKSHNHHVSTRVII